MQCVDSIKPKEEIKAFSHFKKARQFFEPIDAKFEFRFFDNVQQLDSYSDEIQDSGKPVARNIFSDLAFTPPTSYALVKYNASLYKNAIGIHPVGSEFSNNYWRGLWKA